MDKAEVAATVTKSDQFHEELLVLIRKYDLHAGWFVWANEEMDGNQRTAAIMRYGCGGCTASAIAAGLQGIEEDMKETLLDSLNDFASGIATSSTLAHIKEEHTKVH